MKLFSDSEILAVPTREYLSIFYKYAEKNKKKISKDKEEDKGYNEIEYYYGEVDDNDTEQQYGIINEEISEDAMIFMKNDKVLVYSDDEDLYYNSYVGWLDSSDIDDSKYIYIPMSYIDNSSTEENKEQSILIAPFLTSLDNLFECEFKEYFENKEYYDNCNRMLNAKSTSFRYAIYDESGKLEITNDENIDFNDCIISTEYDTSSKSDSKNLLNSECKKNLKNIDKGKKIVIGVIKTDENLDYDYNINLQRKLFPLYKYSSTARIIFFVDILVIIGITAYIIKNELKVDKIYKRDKLPIEIGLVLSVISIVILVALVVNSLDYYQRGLSECSILMIGTSLYTIPCYIFNMECLMSLIRRIKNHKIIDTAIIVKLYRVLKRSIIYIWQNRSTSSKKIIKLIIYSIINMFCVLLIIIGLSNLDTDGWALLLVFIGLIAIIAFNIYVFKIIVDDTKNMEKILTVAKAISGGNLEAKVNVDELYDDRKELGERINSIGDGLQKAVETSIKDERMKSELITNVSHDIKTPLTSIINYIDLIKREDIQDEKLQEYLKVLDMKSQRLKQLTEDLVEASKASTGNIELEKVPLNIKELITQSVAEFSEKFESRKLNFIANISEDNLVIYADGRRCFRIIENLLQNIYKYAMEKSRVYLDVYKEDDNIVISLKNMSEMPLNIDSNELTERFVRGDVSRTTEGSGLGLSIAKNLVKLQGGEFKVVIDGDLFKVIIKFKEYKH
ncbi:HAMP domain-containing histidine kinase [Clostridium sp. MSJ-8]|nr:HAMP domain-containing histidine kinase [Clostridium sp. MSJ-8]